MSVYLHTPICIENQLSVTDSEIIRLVAIAFRSFHGVGGDWEDVCVFEASLGLILQLGFAWMHAQDAVGLWVTTLDGVRG